MHRPINKDLLLLSYYKELRTLYPRELNYVIPRGSSFKLNEILSFLLKSHTNSSLCIDDLMSIDLLELLLHDLEDVYLSMNIKDYNEFLKHPIYAQHLKDFTIIMLKDQNVVEIKKIDTITKNGELKILEENIYKDSNQPLNIMN